MADLLSASIAGGCLFCGYNGAGYYQQHTHAQTCPWYDVGGREERERLLPNIIDRLMRERDEARADAWRYRWLKGRNPLALATVAWCCPEACRYPDPDRAIDAAMAAEERHA